MEWSLVAWKNEVIWSLFDEDQSRRIFSIPLGCRRTQDLLVWKFEATESYSVKSGSRVLISEHLKGTNHIGYNASIYKDFYKLLWEIQIPFKIKIHVWRLINNYVPHLVNLFQRHLLAMCFVPSVKNHRGILIISYGCVEFCSNYKSPSMSVLLRMISSRMEKIIS